MTARIDGAAQAPDAARRAGRQVPATGPWWCASLLGTVVMTAALSGCAGLPPLPPRTATHAFVDTDTTSLGGIVEASLRGAAPRESGFRLLPDGAEALDARLAIIRLAERSIDLQSYEVAADGSGLQILRELRLAAARGVRVRLLVDDLYTAGEDALFRALAAVPGVEVRLFNPLPSRSGGFATRLLFSLHAFPRINHRMHNKLLVVDNRVSISGGRNVGDAYFMRSTSANFADLDVLAAGPVVRELSDVFDLYWNSDHAYPAEAIAGHDPHGVTPERGLDALEVGAAPPQRVAAPSTPAVGRELASGGVALEIAAARVLADSPEKIRHAAYPPDFATVTRSLLATFDAARSEVLVVSPYFIPGDLGMGAITRAVRRGVRVGVVTNALGATDEPLVHWRYTSFRREMLRLGVSIHELAPDLARDAGTFGDFGSSSARLHAKIAVVDKRRVFIGSLNLDGRSARRNTESGLLIESAVLAGAIERRLADDRGRSAYRLRLADDGTTIEWITVGADGAERVLREEPGDHWLRRLRMRLLGLFTPDLFL